MIKNKKRLIIILLVLITVGFILTTIFKMLLISDSKIGATSSLKQIGLSLRQYAHDNAGSFPQLDGIKGLNQLHKALQYSPRMFTYRRSQYTPAQDGDVLTEKNVAFEYRGGLSKNDDAAIAWDKPNNFDRYGTILFTAGHVKGYAGANWMDNILPPLTKKEHKNHNKEKF